MGRRLLAVLGAVAMIVAAAAVRSRIDGSDGSPGVGGSPDRGSGGAGAIVCDRALGDACPRDAGRQDAPATATSLADAASGPTTWISVGPWSEATDAARKLRGRAALFESPAELASTDLVIVVRRGERLGCPAPVTWRCVGDALAEGRLAVSAAPATASDGLMLRAAFVTGRLERTDWGTSDLDPAARDWLTRVDATLEKARSLDGGRSFDDWAGRQFAGPAGFVTTAAGVTSLLGAGGNPRVEVTVPEPLVRVQVLAAGASLPRDDEASLREGLASSGWTLPAEPATGLPSPDVLYALGSVVG